MIWMCHWDEIAGRLEMTHSAGRFQAARGGYYAAGLAEPGNREKMGLEKAEWVLKKHA